MARSWSRSSARRPDPASPDMGFLRFGSSALLVAFVFDLDAIKILPLVWLVIASSNVEERGHLLAPPLHKEEHAD